MKKLARMLAIIAVVLVGILTVGTLPASASTASEEELRALVVDYVAGLDANYTVSVRELGDDGDVIGVSSTRHVEPASVIKLFYAWATLRRVDAGTLNLGSFVHKRITWRYCLTLMITVSDNKCSADIREALGNRTLNSLFAAQGFPDTRVKLNADGTYAGKYSSAADTSLLLRRLEEGTLLSAESTEYFHQLLKDQVWRTRVNKGVPAGIRVENKGGELWVPGGWTQSDAAIVRGPESTYVIVVYGRNDAVRTEIAELSKLVYQHLQKTSVSSVASFPRRQYVTRVDVIAKNKPRGTALYSISAGTLVQFTYTDRNWAQVKQDGKPLGWVLFSSLQLRGAYRWL